MADFNPLSICLCSDDFLPAVTGAGTHVQRITEELVRRGHRISIITTRRPGQPAREVWRGANVCRVFSVRVFGYYLGLPSAATITRILEESSVALIHHHYLGIMMMRVESVGRRLGLPQVYTYHMPVDVLVQHWPMQVFRPLFSRKIVEYCNRFDLIISPSLNLAERIKDEGVRTPVRYITNPVAFDPGSGVEPVERPAPFVVLFAGRLEPEKNIPFLLEASRLALNQGLDAALWIAGTGSQQRRLASLCETLGISKRVHFLGHVEHSKLGNYYAACDVFVLPSLVETQGLVAMEAMRFARPVIVTREIVAARELVEEGRSGFIVDHGSPDELAARLATLAADPALRQRLGRAGQERSLAFAPERVVLATEDAYRAALLSRAGSSRAKTASQ
jgi:glycosyltransferase involved in cell wall biosynthesis